MLKPDVFFFIIACLLIGSSAAHPNDTFVQIGVQKFFVLRIKANFYAARDLCKQYNADLATFKTNDELVAMSNYLLAEGYRSKGKDHFWLSYFDVGRATGHFYSIATGLPMTCTGWVPGQPDNAGGNENCVHIWLRNGKYGMNDNKCSVKMRSICQLHSSHCF